MNWLKSLMPLILADLLKKQIMMQKYQKWKKTVLLILIIVSSQVIHVIQR